MDARSKLIAHMSQLLAHGNKTMVVICNSSIDRIFHVCFQDVFKNDPANIIRLFKIDN